MSPKHASLSEVDPAKHRTRPESVKLLVHVQSVMQYKSGSPVEGVQVACRFREEKASHTPFPLHPEDQFRFCF